MTRVVLDASAAVEVALWTTRGADLAEAIGSAEDVIVPGHFVVEVASALRRMEARRAVDRTAAVAALTSIRALRVTTVDVAELLDVAWALRHNVTIADGLYIALARRAGAVLVTGDVRLSRAPGLQVEIVRPMERE